MAELWAIAQQQGHSRRSWARASGVDRSSISYLLSTRRSPAVETLEMLAAPLGHRLAVIPDLQEAA
jgi:hypothetical protein